MKMKHRNTLSAALYLAPSLAGFLIFTAIPYIIIIFYCFTAGTNSFRWVGARNFLDLLKNSSFTRASINTIIFNITSVPVITVMSFGLAVLLNRQLEVVRYYRSFFILPLVLPVASVIMVWRIMFSYNGALNMLFSKIGVPQTEWLKSSWSVAVLAVLFIWKNAGYNVIIFLSALNSIPLQYYEAAKIDGAGAFMCLRHITIPFISTSTFFVLLISFINSLKVFREAYLLAGNYPDLRLYMLQHFINNNFLNLNYHKLSTSAFIMTVTVSMLVLPLIKSQARLSPKP